MTEDLLLSLFFVFQQLFPSQCSCVELTRTPQRLKEKSLACCHPHDTLSRGLWCVLIFSLFGHVSRIWGLIGVAVDSPVYEPLVEVMDTSGPGEVLCFVCLSGDQY